MNNIKSLTSSYFKFFSNKDISSLRTMFDNQIYLRDWEIEAIGIKNVIEANEKIFKSVESIKVTPVNLYVNGNTVLAEINILINNNEEIKVVDIIEFNENSKIANIRAFKG